MSTSFYEVHLWLIDIYWLFRQFCWCWMSVSIANNCLNWQKGTFFIHWYKIYVHYIHKWDESPTSHPTCSYILIVVKYFCLFVWDELSFHSFPVIPQIKLALNETSVFKRWKKERKRFSNTWENNNAINIDLNWL